MNAITIAEIVVAVLVVVMAFLIFRTNKKMNTSRVSTVKSLPVERMSVVRPMAAKVLKGQDVPAPTTEPEVRCVVMYDETDKTYHGKGILCTYDEFKEYLARWTEADRIVDKVSYIESSHILNQRPVWVK